MFVYAERQHSYINLHNDQRNINAGGERLVATEIEPGTAIVPSFL